MSLLYYAEKLIRIIELDNDLNKIQDSDVLLERILLEARRAVNADAGSIYICEGDSLAIKFAQNDTLQAQLPLGRKLIYSIFRVPIDDRSISGYVARTGKPLNIPDVYNLPADAPYSYDAGYDQKAGYRTRSMLAVPLSVGDGKVIGVLQVINARNDQGGFVPFDKDHEVFAAHFAVNATVALQRALLTRAILLRMISMAELRDPHETGAHVNRVAGYAAEIYEHWAVTHGITEVEAEKGKDVLRMAAMLHDVGKVAISDLILKKNAKFTPEEFQIMTAHSRLGARLFVDKQSVFDEVAKQVALTHHENWDGTGYPGCVDPLTGNPLKTDDKGRAVRLKGEEIPLFGRIVAIADVYDALGSKRCYKDAWSEEDVLNEMRKLRGTKFDPALLDCFFEVLPQIRQVNEKYRYEDGVA